MFNPYFARPIGSEQFERHLLDLMVQKDQEAKEAVEALYEIPINLRVCDHDPVRWDPNEEGWKLLDLAIYAMAISDYLCEYEMRLWAEDSMNFVKAEVYESRCLTLENEYFRQTEEGEAMIDFLLREIIHNSDDVFLRQRITRIQKTQKRIHRWIWEEQAHGTKSYGGRMKP